MPDVIGGSPVTPLPAPSSDLVEDLWTYQDAVDLLVDVFQIPQKNGMVLRAAMRAVDNALVRLPAQADWSYYNRRAMLRTQDPYSTGTIAYTHSTRQVTLTGGTWPSWAAFGRIRIESQNYDVESRSSDSVIVLPEGENPGANVAAGASYVLSRNEYVLPDDFLKVGTLFDQASMYPLEYLSADEAQAMQGLFNSTGYPEWYTIRRSANHVGRRVLVLAPVPSGARNYEFSYGARPLPVRIREFAARTCSTSGTTVTFVAGTVLPSDITGSIIRFSSSGDQLPTSKYGRLDTSGEAVFNLPAAEAMVYERTGDTTLTADRTLPTLTNVRYVISDAIDIEPITQQDAFIALMESEFARFTYKDHEQRYGRLREALSHIREGMQADYAYKGPSAAGAGSYRSLRLADFIDLISEDA